MLWVEMHLAYKTWTCDAISYQLLGAQGAMCILLASDKKA